MTVLHKKAVLIAFVTGTIIPCLLEGVGRYLDAIGVHAASWWSTAMIYLWPFVLALIETSDNAAGYIAFALTAILNGILYALIVLIIGYPISLFKRDKTPIED